MDTFTDISERHARQLVWHDELAFHGSAWQHFSFERLERSSLVDALGIGHVVGRIRWVVVLLGRLVVSVLVLCNRVPRLLRLQLASFSTEFIRIDFDDFHRLIISL